MLGFGFGFGLGVGGGGGGWQVPLLFNGFPSSVSGFSVTSAGEMWIRDYNNILQLNPEGVAPVEGGRLASTVAEGAALGDNTLSDISLWDFSNAPTSSEAGGVVSWGPTNGSEFIKLDGTVAPNGGVVAEVSVTVSSYVSGDLEFRVSQGVFEPAGITEDGEYKVYVTTGVGSTDSVADIGVTEMDFVINHIKQVIPQWVDTDLSGDPVGTYETVKTSQGKVVKRWTGANPPALRVTPSYTNKCETPLSAVPVTGSELWDDTGVIVQSGWADNGDGTYTGAAANGFVFDNPICVIGKVYRISFEILEYTSGTVQQAAGNASLGSGGGALGVFTDDVVCAGNTIGGVSSLDGFTGKIGNLSMMEITDGLGTIATTSQPTNITGLTYSGDAAGFVEVVSVTAADLIGTDEHGNAVDLSALATSDGSGGYLAYRLDNSAGAAVAIADAGGNVGNTNSHSVSAYILTDGVSRVQLNGAAGTDISAKTTLTRVSETLTPSGAGNVLRVQVAAGVTSTFLAPNLTETAVTMPLAEPSTTVSAVTVSCDWPSVVDGSSLAVSAEVEPLETRACYLYASESSPSPKEGIYVFSTVGALGLLKYADDTPHLAYLAKTLTAQEITTLQSYSDGSGIGNRVDVDGGGFTAYTTNANADTAEPGETFQIGTNHVGSSHFNGLIREISIYQTKAKMEAGL